MKFKVILGWRSEYLFDDIDVAANFAVTAFKAGLNYDEDNDEIVKIVLLKEDEEDE